MWRDPAVTLSPNTSPPVAAPLVDRHRKLGSSENKTRQNEHPEDGHAKYRDHGEDQDGLENVLPFPTTGNDARQDGGGGGGDSVHGNGRRVRLNSANGERETAAGWDERKRGS